MKDRKFKKITIAILAVLVLAFFITGCNDEAPNNLSKEPKAESTQKVSADLRSYFPLIEGMNYSYTGKGIEYASFTRRVQYIDRPYLQLAEDNGGTVMGEVYRVTEDKLELIHKGEEFYQDDNLISQVDKDSPPIKIILEAPLKVGKSWTTDGEKREIVAIDETVTLPAGRFYNVIKIKSTRESTDSTTYEYYAENIGLILREFHSGETRIISKLASFGIDKNQ